MDIITTAKVSPKWKLNIEDIKKTVTNGIIYLAVTIIVVVPLVLPFIPSTGERYVALTAGLMVALKIATEIAQRLADGPVKK